MNKMRRTGMLWLLISSSIFILWGSVLERNSPGGMADFKAVYYGARCLIHHSDPYKEGDFLRVYRAEGGTFPTDPALSLKFYRAVPICINLPTSLFLLTPLAMLAWGPAHVLWMIISAGSLILAAYLMWQLAGSYAPGVSLLLVCLVLANSEILLMSGNLAGIAISLCVIAAWCFLRERFVLVGMLCLALSLAIKPHDAGLVWLYFLLAGGAVRKRALQTLVLTIVLALPAVLWVTHVAPQWIEELHSNLSATTAHGDLNDPGPVSISFHNANMVIDLQAAISIFRDDPRMYNPASYVICGALILAWSIHTLRTGFSTEKSLIALAAIAAFSMLPIYHREYDAKLLLLAVPACALLWAKGGLTGWLALLINSAGVILTGDIPAALLIIFCDHLHLGSASVLGKIVTVILMRPAPLILLVMGIFYMWMYLKGADPRLLTENAK